MENLPTDWLSLLILTFVLGMNKIEFFDGDMSVEGLTP